MTWRAARSLLVLRDEINRAYPNRDKASDGIIGNQEHSSRVSDHNPDRNGVVHAIDIDKDGIPAEQIVRAIIHLAKYGDPRPKYAIWQRRIYSPKTAWVGEAYTGTNAHDHHFHLSVTDAAGDSTDPWHVVSTTPPPPPTPPTEDHLMFILNPVTDGADTTQYFVNGAAYCALTAAEAQQFRNSGFATKDMEPAAFKVFKQTAHEVPRP